MTTFMKIEAVIYYVLKVLGYICGFVGVFGVLGFVGSLECDRITIAQCIVYEIHAFCLIGASYLLYYIRVLIEEDFTDRCRLLHRARRQRMQRANTMYN